MFKPCHILGFVLLFVASGCSEEGSRCVIGQSIACACRNGSTGAQVCQDGSRYSACSCDPSTDPTNPDPPNRDLSTNPGVDMRTSGNRVFVTAASFDGKLSALFNGDNIDQLCQTAADGAALGGTFITWAVSPAGVLPIDRLTAQGPWFGLDGKLLFNNKANLKTTPMNTLEIDEFKNPCTSCGVWTGLNGGHGAVPSCFSSKHWNTNTSGTGRAGRTSYSGSSWVDYRDEYCSSNYHLICVEN